MSVFRAVGAALAAPRARLEETDVEDLSTYRSRAEGAVDGEALVVAPPAPAWTPLSASVPGRLVQGTLPEDDHASFVLRMPRDWSGGLVAAAAPGLLGERSLDLYWSDYCLSRGFAFACTDKGARLVVSGGAMFVPMAPENRVGRWYPRLKALAVLARERCRARYGRDPGALYAVGVSNGGYLARLAVERDPRLFSGGVDVSGVLWRADAPALLRELPAALSKTGLSPLEAEYRVYWELTLACLLADFDPGYSGRLEDYDPAARAGLRERLEPIQNTGRLRRPLVSVAGGGDLLVPSPSHAEGYARLVAEAGASSLHRLRVVPGAPHMDADVARHQELTPLMPHAHAAFDELVGWVADGAGRAPVPA